LVAIKCAIW